MRQLIESVNLVVLLSSLAAIFIGALWIWFRRKVTKGTTPQPPISKWMLATVGVLILFVSAGSVWEQIQTSKVYEVTVRVRGAHNESLSDVHVFTPVGGELKKLSDSEWILRVPASALERDSLIVYGEAGSNIGIAKIVPGIRRHLKVDLILSRKESTVIIKGIVIDESGKPIGDAHVDISEGINVRTEPTGNFAIEDGFHQPGTPINVEVWKEGYDHASYYDAAIDQPLTFILRRASGKQGIKKGPEIKLLPADVSRTLDGITIRNKALTPIALQGWKNTILDRYAIYKNNKALAVSDSGWFGSGQNQPGIRSAAQLAMENCRRFVENGGSDDADTCAIMMVNDLKIGKW